MEATIHPVATPENLAQARGLMFAYGRYLAANPTGAANICIEGYESELAGLPAPYAPPAGVILLATEADRPAGCVAFKPLRPAIPTGPGERACEMKRLWIDPEFRGRRLGVRLIEEGLAWARAAGYTAVYLDTVPAAMPEANALYQRFGFKQITRYNDNSVADVEFFRLRLT